MFKRFFIVLAVGFLVMSLAHPALALVLDSGLDSAAGDIGAGYNISQQLPQLVGSLIKVVIGLLGVIFLVLTIYAGITWMTAGGEEKKIAQAKGTLSTAVIGLVIALAAYSITDFVLSQLITATGAT
ncbi:MAG: hypothetical protein WAZ14_01155 [Patescibacteria group bacterium]